jgi:hypothetical protein
MAGVSMTISIALIPATVKNLSSGGFVTDGAFA